MTAAEAHVARALHVALSSRTTQERIDELIEATDALAGALQTLRRSPTADGAERITHQLTGMQRFAGNLLTALACRVEGGGNGQ